MSSGSRRSSRRSATACGERRARRAAHLPADAGRLQRDLFRTGVPGALSRLPAGRGRRPRRQRRPHSCPHHRRLEARRRDVAPRRCRFPRPARAERRLAPRRARPADGVREGSVVVANMPGSGVLEARALLGFLPALSPRLLGEDLKMPNIATWWCGQAAAREEVLSRSTTSRSRAPSARGVPGFATDGPVLAGDLRLPSASGCARRIDDRGIDYVGQELVRLSTTPVLGEGPPEPRPFRPAGLCGRDARTAGSGDARRLLPHLRPARCARGHHGRGRAIRRRLGARPTSRWSLDAAAGRRQVQHPPHPRHAAEPRRRQPVLARPLPRTRRGDAADHPRARRSAVRDSPRAIRAAARRPARAHPAPARRLGRGAADKPRSQSGARSRPTLCRARNDYGSALSLVRSAHRTASSLARTPVARRLAG